MSALTVPESGIMTSERHEIKKIGAVGTMLTPSPTSHVRNNNKEIKLLWTERKKGALLTKNANQ